MSRIPSSYVHDVDRLIAETHPREIAEFYGQSWPDHDAKHDVRLECPITNCETSSYGQLVVNVGKPQNPIFCHSCGVRGNLLTLMWMMKHQEPPSGGRLRGGEFKEVVADLQSIRSRQQPNSSPVESATPAPQQTVIEVNVPLVKSTNARARELVTLDQDGATDVAAMPPYAASYFRNRDYLSPELCQKWKVVYLPKNAKGTLRGRVIYPIESELGEVLAWVGRDPEYEHKHRKWINNGKPKKGEPIKHRFPSGDYFRRGLELFGQQARRLHENGYQQSIAEIGLLVVEGMNDVLRLDALGVPSVAVMSNRVTDEQVQKVVRWARTLSAGKVSVMFDNDKHGREGAADAVWRVAHDTPVQTAWPREASGFDDRQPESLSLEEWTAIANSLRERWS